MKTTKAGKVLLNILKEQNYDNLDGFGIVLTKNIKDILNDDTKMKIKFSDSDVVVLKLEDKKPIISKISENHEIIFTLEKYYTNETINKLAEHISKI